MTKPQPHAVCCPCPAGARPECGQHGPYSVRRGAGEAAEQTCRLETGHGGGTSPSEWLPQRHVTDPGHSAKSAGGRSQLSSSGKSAGLVIERSRGRVPAVIVSTSLVFYRVVVSTH